jgi:hypothetical protein
VLGLICLGHGCAWEHILASCSVQHVPVIQTASCSEQNDRPQEKQTLGLPNKPTACVICLSLLLSHASRAIVRVRICVFNSSFSLPDEMPVTAWHFFLGKCLLSFSPNHLHIQNYKCACLCIRVWIMDSHCEGEPKIEDV